MLESFPVGAVIGREPGHEKMAVRQPSADITQHSSRPSVNVLLMYQKAILGI